VAKIGMKEVVDQQIGYPFTAVQASAYVAVFAA
jgi:hypothetical protein